MPWVEASVLEALIAAFAANGAGAICVPTHRGRTGNPVLWGRGYFGELMSLIGDSGGKPLMARHSAHVVETDVATDSIFADADIASDLIRSS